MSLAVELRAASVARNGTPVELGIDLAIERGAWFGVIGANGSGKTSLLRAIAGRLPFSAGACRLDGSEVAGDRAARAAAIGFAPPAELLPDVLRGRDILELVAGDLDRALPRLGPVRAALGLDALLDRRVGDCSAGMRQRLAVAAAFVEDGRPSSSANRSTGSIPSPRSTCASPCAPWSTTA